MNELRQLIMDGSDELALALNCYFEARAEWRVHGDISYTAVTAVVMNRANHPNDFASTPRECIAAHRQFSWTNYDQQIKDPQYHKALEVAQNPDGDYGDAWDAAKRIAADAISIKMKNPIENATFYFNPHVCAPRWAATLRLVADIGAHRFMASYSDPDMLWPAERE